MKNRMLLFMVFIMVNGTAFSQNHTSKNNYYKRFQGNIGDNINVTANIVRLYDNISGNYIYYFVGSDDDMYYGKTIELNGEIDKYDSLRLKEFGSEDFTFRGLVRDGQYNGVWNATEGKPVEFTMKELYPNGSLPFEIFYLKSESKLDNEIKESPVAEIELTLIYPSGNYFQPAIADSVKRLIAESYFGVGFGINNPQAMLEHFEEEYFGNYTKQAKQWHDVGGQSFNWEKMINMSVTYNSNYLLCTEYLRFAYAGGAHGMTNLSYDIINLDSGETLGYEDIFIDNIDSVLTEVLTNQLRLNYQIPDEVPLKEAGFFVDEVNPNKNLYVDGSGIGFVYNSYEIAPYARGATKILLDYDKIQHLIKKGTPVYRMSHRNRK